METLGNKSVAKSGIPDVSKYYCESCDYKCCKKYNWTKHLLTSKHQTETSGSQMEAESGKKWQKEQTISCENCYKDFKSRSGLWKHKQTCKPSEESDDEDKKTDELAELVKYLMKENSEMKNMMMEQSTLMLEVIKGGTMQNSHNTTTNSHNKAFNLQFFLNETCKDAMNITEFVESIKLQLSDLERVGELGYVEGISNIIVKNLKDLDVTQRPVHCTDKKRETMYVKDQNKWEKEDNELKRMKDLVRTVRDRNITLIATWRDLYPECVKSNSKKTTQFNQICMEAFGGETGGEKGTKQEKEEKIISKIAKAVIINKD